MSAKTASVPLERIDEVRWRIPRDPRRGMRVEGRVYADDRLIASLRPSIVMRSSNVTKP